ncbi:MAG: VOC family protein [Chlorobi bacterium]|nr:VOC family protein [Chlorobiota bacterium]
MITGLHHAQITCPTGMEDEARDFYCRVLQLEEVEKPGVLKKQGGLWLKVGDRDLHIGTEDGDNPQLTKAHLAYEVTDIAFWRSRLVAEGIALEDSVPIPGFERFEFRDPFGNRVEMIMSVGK